VYCCGAGPAGRGGAGAVGGTYGLGGKPAAMTGIGIDLGCR